VEHEGEQAQAGGVGEGFEDVPRSVHKEGRWRLSGRRQGWDGGSTQTPPPRAAAASGRPSAAPERSQRRHKKARGNGDPLASLTSLPLKHRPGKRKKTER
jgi:hypothetical protein